VQEDVDSGTGAADADYDGNNIGTYFEAGYKHPDFPMYGVIRAESGDVEQDPMFMVGVAF